MKIHSDEFLLAASEIFCLFVRQNKKL